MTSIPAMCSTELDGNGALCEVRFMCPILGEQWPGAPIRIEPGSTKRNLEEATKAQRTAIVDEEERRRRTREKVRRFEFCANQADGERFWQNN